MLLPKAVAHGHQVTAQTRDASRIPAAEGVSVIVGSPQDEAFLNQHMAGHDAVVSAIGINTIGKTTLFSESASAVIAGMQANGVKRLVTITGIGAGDTRGHGGWLYNFAINPLFTRNRYADKNRQEALIEQTDLDWTIVRPAPYTNHPSTGPWHTVTTEIPAGLQLCAITREEVAAFVLDCLERASFIHQKPFIGHS